LEVLSNHAIWDELRGDKCVMFEWAYFGYVYSNIMHVGNKASRPNYALPKTLIILMDFNFFKTKARGGVLIVHPLLLLMQKKMKGTKFECLKKIGYSG
jgi:hypothetical protein